MSKTLLLSQNENIATISFNRPAAMNSFDNVMANELEAMTEQVALDKSIRAVVIKGAGSLFMAGGDIHFFKDQLDVMPAGIVKIVRTLNASILNLMTMPKPVVASAHGAVAGVGMSFLLACDLAIVADNTRFTMAYSGLGISPDGGASYLLPRIVGMKKAFEWMLFPDVINAETALQHGLVNWVVPENQLADETQKLMLRLAKGPTKSYAETKKLLVNSWDNSLPTQLEAEGVAFATCGASEDFKRGVTSFLAKKKPEFLGN